MKLKPLTQWFCDTCGEIIREPRHGWFEWVHDEDGRNYGFRICHHAANDETEGGRDCYAYEDAPRRSDLPLEDMLGTRGVAAMLEMLDMGELHDPKAKHLMRIKDVREWTVMFRRLFIPHFEEARLYFKKAKADGYYEGVNEVWPYIKANLEDVIEKYGED